MTYTLLAHVQFQRAEHGWVRRWLVFVASLAVLFTQFINIVFAFFPPLEELYRVLDSSPERLAVAFFLFHAAEFSICIEGLKKASLGPGSAVRKKGKKNRRALADFFLLFRWFFAFFPRHGAMAKKRPSRVL